MDSSHSHFCILGIRTLCVLEVIIIWKPSHPVLIDCTVDELCRSLFLFLRIIFMLYRFLSGYWAQTQATTRWIQSAWQYCKDQRDSLDNNTAQYSNMHLYLLFVSQRCMEPDKTHWTYHTTMEKSQSQDSNSQFWLDSLSYSEQYVQQFPDSQECGSQFEQILE